MPSGRLVDYLGRGNDSNKPVTLDLQDDSLGLYYSDDTKVLWVWNKAADPDPAWEEFTPAGAIANLTDVDLTDLADGDVLKWNAADSKWEHFAIPAAPVGEAPEDGDLYARKDGNWELIPAPVVEFEALSDVDWSTPPTDGQFFMWDAATSKLVPHTLVIPAGSIAGASDYDNTTPATDGQVVAWDDSEGKFKPVDQSGGGGGSAAAQVIALAITNPGAESAAMTGWSTPAGNSAFTAVTTPSGTGAPHSGSYLFNAGSNAIAGMYQDLDISTYATQIDTGTLLASCIGWVMNDFTTSEQGWLHLSALDSSGNELARDIKVINNAAIMPQSVWIPLQCNIRLPVGTRKVRIKAQALRLDGTANDTSFDDFSACLVIPGTANTMAQDPVNLIDKVPDSPSAWNDEFIGNVVDPAWTWVNQSDSGATASASQKNGMLRITTDAPISGQHVRMLVKNRPAGDFDIVAKVRLCGIGRDYHQAILILYNSTTGKFIETRLHYRAFGATYFSWARWNSVTSGSTETNVQTNVSVGYVRFRLVGTTLTTYASPDGIYWSLLNTEDLADFVGVAADQIGLGYDCENTTTNFIAGFEWIRDYGAGGPPAL